MPACARPVGYVPRQTHECDAAVLGVPGGDAPANRGPFCPEVALARVRKNGYPSALAVHIIEGEHLIRIVMPPIVGEDHTLPKPRRWLEALIDAHEQRGPRRHEQLEFDFNEPDRRRRH